MAVEPKLATIGNALIDIRETINGFDSNLGLSIIGTLGNDIRTLNSRKGVWKWVKKSVVTGSTTTTLTNSDFSSSDYITTMYSSSMETGQLVINLAEYSSWTATINVVQTSSSTCYYKLATLKSSYVAAQFITSGSQTLSGSSNTIYINTYYSVGNHGTRVPFNTLMNDVQIEITAVKDVYSDRFFLEKDTYTNTIPANAYKDDLSLIAITIPSGIVNIGNNAFEGCDNLQFLYCDGSPTLGTDVFDRTDYVFNNLITE